MAGTTHTGVDSSLVHRPTRRLTMEPAMARRKIQDPRIMLMGITLGLILWGPEVMSAGACGAAGAPDWIGGGV
jgi:hypothetical protein